MPKFSEIKQLTQDGNYRGDVPLDYLPKVIKGYENNYGLRMDVDFQRAHVWNDQQRSAYVEHLLTGGNGPRTIRFNCPNWNRVTRSDEPCLMVVVDGKQRLTTCLRFMNNEIPAFGYLYKEYEDRLRIAGPGLVFRINDLNNRADVLRWYLEMNEGGVAHTKAELDKVKKLLAEEELKQNVSTVVGIDVAKPGSERTAKALYDKDGKITSWHLIDPQEGA